MKSTMHLLAIKSNAIRDGREGRADRPRRVFARDEQRPDHADRELGEEAPAQAARDRVEGGDRAAGSVESSGSGSRAVMRTPRPIVSSTVTATPMTEDRTVRNLIHSARVDAINVDSLVTRGVLLLSSRIRRRPR